MIPSRRLFLFVAVLALAATPAAYDASFVKKYHQAGSKGGGIRVAVLDTGFRGYRNHLGHCLPRDLWARSFRTDGDLEAKDSQHGILCGEIVHTLAPDAELLFANWQPDSQQSFIDAVAWARRRGAHVITCSVIMPCWSDGEGGGSSHADLKYVVGDGTKLGDPLCIACAGNVAERHWGGHYRGDAAGWHRWNDNTINNAVTPWGDEPVSVELCRPAGSNFELHVFDANGTAVGQSISRSDDGNKALVVRFLPRPKSTYTARVRGSAGSFHLTVLGGTLAHATSAGSIPFPGDGSEWMTLGAWENGRRAGYSSCGPNSRSPKPDLVGSVPFPSKWRPQPFGGTSAAAPQAAGLAAVYWSRHPHLSASQVRSALCGAAIDLMSPGHDHETGFGLLRLPPIE